jgi:hypothetical protein
VGGGRGGSEVTPTTLWASRIYCVTDIDPDHRKLSQLEAVVRFLTREDPDLQCECQPPVPVDTNLSSGTLSSGLCREKGGECHSVLSLVTGMSEGRGRFQKEKAERLAMGTGQDPHHPGPRILLSLHHLSTVKGTHLSVRLVPTTT